MYICIIYNFMYVCMLFQQTILARHLLLTLGASSKVGEASSHSVGRHGGTRHESRHPQAATHVLYANFSTRTFSHCRGEIAWSGYGTLTFKKPSVARFTDSTVAITVNPVCVLEIISTFVGVRIVHSISNTTLQQRICLMCTANASAEKH